MITRDNWPYALVPMIPIAVVLELVHASASIIFAASALGVIPTAALMGRATEELAERAGPGIGGLLNVTFGNFPELLIAFFALLAGLQEVVKASIIGSILGNILLVMGAAMFVGGLGRDRQTFNHRAASTQATMLILAAAAMAMPASTSSCGRRAARAGVEDVQLGLCRAAVAGRGDRAAAQLRGRAVVLAEDPPRPVQPGEDERRGARTGTSRGPCAARSPCWPAGLAVGLMSEILVGSISETAEHVGISEFFIGVIVVAVVGNAAEHWVAVYVAAKNKMDLAVNIAIGSSAQVALFVAPVLVLLRCFRARAAVAAVQRLRARGGVPRRDHRDPHRARRRVDVVRGPAAARGLRGHGLTFLLRLTTSLHRPARRPRGRTASRVGRPAVRFCVNVSVLFTEAPFLERFASPEAGLPRGRVLVAERRGPRRGPRPRSPTRASTWCC